MDELGVDLMKESEIMSTDAVDLSEATANAAWLPGDDYIERVLKAADEQELFY
jgi:hypothetical protein